MKIRFLILFCLLNTFCSGQDFSEKWKADSSGGSGFRKQSVAWDSVHKVYLINGVDLTGYQKKNLIALLGDPDLYGSFQYEHGVGFFLNHTHRPRRTMIYYLRGKNSMAFADGEGYLTFIIRKKRVFYYNRYYLRRFEEHKFLGALLIN